MESFAFDTVLAESIRALIVARHVRTVVETGTWTGGTTYALAGMVPRVHSIEMNPEHHAQAKALLAVQTNVTLHLGRSQDVLPSLMPTIARPALYYLDAHWGGTAVLDEIEAKCKEQAGLPPERMKNHVAMLYGLFTLGQIEGKVAELIRSKSLVWQGSIDLVYQSVEGLRAAMPEHTGDWYFTGEYPTPGGYRVLNTAYLNWRRGAEGKRAY